MSSERRLRIRFTALNSYPLFDPRDHACVGGTETRAWLLARGLAEWPEFEVHFVVRAPRLFRTRQFDQVTVWNRGDGLDGVREQVSRAGEVLPRFPWCRVRHWNPGLLWRVPLLAAARLIRGRRTDPTQPDPLYTRMPADVDCCFGASADSATVVASARSSGRPSLLFLASNSDLDERFRPGSTYVTRNGERGDVCWFALQNATGIVAQHTAQQDLLRERFGRECTILPNLIDLPSWDRAAAGHSPLLESLPVTRFALWVGRADDFHKRPRLCLDLARRLPQVTFLMVVNPGDPRIEQELRTTQPSNVRLVESIPPAEMPAVLSRSVIYVSTGAQEYEGSPNLFLQAAAARVPVASLDVSTALLEEADSGFVAGGDLCRLADYVQNVWTDRALVRQQGLAGRDYVERCHDAGVIIPRLASLVREAAG